MSSGNENKNDIKEDESVSKKRVITRDDLYRRSSQYRMWSYTREGLDEQKFKVNEKGKSHALKEFAAALEKIKQADETFSQFESELSAGKLADLLTADEEKRYLIFYSENIIKLANSFRMPTQVKATAMSFFKKFYLVNSVMEYHPKNILYTCVFLAAKSENYFMSIESFCHPLPKTEPKDVLDLEFLVLLSLKFTLFVHHPFRPLYGFFLDFQTVLLHPEPAIPGLKVEALCTLYDGAKKWLAEHALISDVGFLFSPPHIALAAMYDTNKKVTEKYLKMKYFAPNTVEQKQEGGQSDGTKLSELEVNSKNYDLLLSTINECITLAKSTPKTTREESTEIDKKCFYALNPERLIKKRLNKLKTGGTPA